MATWNGSYYDNGDPSYYTDRNLSAGPSAENWDFLTDNSSAASKQNIPISLDNSYCNGNKYHKNGRKKAFTNNYRSDFTNLSENTENVEESSKNLSQSESNLVKKSNLHVTANEFIPDKKFNKKKLTHFRQTTVESNSVFDYSDSRSKPSSSDVFYANNRNRFDNKSYSNWQNPVHEPKEFARSEPQSSHLYKKSYRTTNTVGSNRFKNNRYFNSKQQMDRFSNSVQSCDRRKNYSNNSSVNFVNKYSKNVPTTTVVQQGNSSNSSQVEYQDQLENQLVLTEFRVQYTKNDEANKEFSEYNQGRQMDNGQKHQRRYANTNKNSYKEKKNNYQDQCYYSPSYTKSKYEQSRNNNKNHDQHNHEKEKIKETKNWRPKLEDANKSYAIKRAINKKIEQDENISQRERLTEQLNRGKLECLVCCENIKQTDYIWSCSNCYHVLHLKCIQKWAKSSQSENGWRCPACQNVNLLIPGEYYCFCGKTITPEWNRRDTAHSCGEICGRKNICVHTCTLPCHPGSCPTCIAMVVKHCGCGRISQTFKCNTVNLLECDAICNKILNCGIHKCEKKCHHGDCGSCEKMVEQVCYCGKDTREVTCEAHVSVSYSCNAVCNKLQDCENHKCKKICHPELCEPCLLIPEKITTCYCGQTLLTEKRNSCLDPIATCEKICSKPLKCGQPSNPHTCKSICHEGDCPECDLTTNVRCRCGKTNKQINCRELTTKADDARCERKCTKKRFCGKHKCNQFCCIDIEHDCPLPCSKTLSCGKHKCEQTCHRGRCQPCWRSSFEELYCECGAAVIYPPVSCGTRRPVCDKPCSREHSCDHEVLHNCHSDPVCPPCTVLTEKLCYGKHKVRKSVPCYVNEISCGMPCNKPISCSRHKCITTCHPGPCEKPGQQCIQPCTVQRDNCGHICGTPCHDGPCPDVPCKETVKVTCQCGHRSTTRICAENAQEYQRIASSILASKMAEMQLGHSVNLEEVFGQGTKKKNQLKTLECNDECKTIERNRRLALGLQIVNPDLSGKLMPRYSDFMKRWAKKDPHFCQMIHDKLSELVQLAKTSKQKSRSYSFEIMNGDKRHFVHEYCEHFGCEGQSYDAEPNRNVVATAMKDKCWMPSYSLLEMIDRENGQKKVAGPMLNSSTKDNNSVKTVLLLSSKKAQKFPTTSYLSRSPEPEIDYFDFKG